MTGQGEYGRWLHDEECLLCVETVQLHEYRARHVCCCVLVLV